MATPLRLTVFEGDQLVAEHRFEQKSIRLGRSETADVRLDDPGVGRLHAVIDATPDARGYELIEMGYSPDGTRVNGERVTKHALQHGDVVSLGRFRIEIGLDEMPAELVADTQDVVVAEPDPAATPDLTDEPVEGDRGIRSPAEVASSGMGPEDTSSTLPVPEPVPGPPMTPPAGYPPPGHPAMWMPPPVPNNLASASVPEEHRALEVKLIWAGRTVLETLNLTEEPRLTMGDERKVTGFGPLQRVVRCDLEVPSRGLPAKTHVLARRIGTAGTTYQLDLPPGLVGRIERADGTVVPLELLYAGQRGGEPDGTGGTRYLLPAEETVYLGYASLVIQLRYVRRTRMAPVPFFERVNYVWANVLLLALFFHVLAIGSFLATPEQALDLTDELHQRRNRFIETRLALVERERKEGGNFLDKLKSGPADKAKGKEGKAGRQDATERHERMASKGKPDEREQARRAMDRLLGLGAKGAAASLLGGNGAGGEVERHLGNLRGRELGDARGLGGLGTRGTGIGGGGLSMTSVGVGELGTRGKGGGGEGGLDYGEGAARLGGKRERDVEITAGRAIVRGSLSKEIIRRHIQKNRAKIRYCYERELQRSPGLFGKIATEFIIDASGRVTEARVKQNTMGVEEVGRCVTAKLRTIKFPKPKGGGIVVVNYPFLFKASG